MGSTTIMGPNFVLINGLWIRAYASTDANRGVFTSLLPTDSEAMLNWNPNLEFEDVKDGQKRKPHDAVPAESPPGEIETTLKGITAQKLALLHAHALTDITEDATQEYDYYKTGRWRQAVFYELWAYGRPVGTDYGMALRWPRVKLDGKTVAALMGKKQPVIPFKAYSYADENGSTEDDFECYVEDDADPPAFVTSLSVVSGSVGASVTITGKNFGSAVGTSKIYIGATAFVTPTWTSDTSLTGVIPAGATGGLIKVKKSDTKVGYTGVYFTVGES